MTFPTTMRRLASAAAVRSRALAIAIFSVGLLAFLFLCITIERSPLVSFDDSVLASASRTFVGDGDGTPAVYPPESITFPFPLIFGPVFFWLQGHAFELMGVSLAVGRLVPLVAALGTALAAGAVTLAAGGSRSWALAAFGFVMLAPEMARSATMGRMDTLAVALELTGLAFFVAAMNARRPAAAWMGMASGSVWALAALTTPRAFPFLIGVALAAALSLRHHTPLRHGQPGPGLPAVAAGGMLALGITLWSIALGVTPIAWALATVKGTLDDPGVITSSAALFQRSDAVLITGTAATLPAVIMTWRRIAGERGSAAFLVLAAATGNAVLLMLAGGVNFVPLYFGIPLQVGVLAAAANLSAAGRLPRSLMAWGMLVLVVFTAYRVVRHVDTFQVWEARSPAGLDRMLQAYVRPGTVVLGYEEFYYYAVERAGARFLMMNNEEFNFATWRLAWPQASRPGSPPAAAPRPDYFVWPDAKPMPVPAAFECATRFPLARYSPRVNRRSIFDPRPGTTDWSFWRTYPDTVLYTVAPDCDPIGNLAREAE